MKMKKTDIGVVATMYAICIAFYIFTLKLKPASQTYPKFCIFLLGGLTTLYLIKMLYQAKKYGVESGVKEVFDGFLSKQFYPVFFAAIGYLILMNYLGFYISTIIFMTVVLLYLKVPKKYTVITVIAIIVLIYCAFTLFLGVKLPAGKLLKGIALFK